MNNNRRTFIKAGLATIIAGTLGGALGACAAPSVPVRPATPAHNYSIASQNNTGQPASGTLYVQDHPTPSPSEKTLDTAKANTARANPEGVKGAFKPAEKGETFESKKPSAKHEFKTQQHKNGTSDRTSLDDIVIPLANPLTDSIANTTAYRTASTTIGAVIEHLSRNEQFDKTRLGRTAETLLTLSLDNFLCVLSHEAGHYRVMDAEGGAELHLQPFAYGIFHGGHANSVGTRTRHIIETPFAADGIRIPSTSAAQGINQTIHNAVQVWTKTRQHMNVIDAIGYINNRLNGTQYGLGYALTPNYGGDLYSYFYRLAALETADAAQQLEPSFLSAKGERIYRWQLFDNAFWKFWSDGTLTPEEERRLSDIEREFIDAQETENKIFQQFTQARQRAHQEWPGFIAQYNRNEAILALLDIPLWESFYALGDFIATGTRERTPLALRAGDFAISPPTFQHYLAPDGEFASMRAHLQHPDFGLTLSFGRDLDFTQRIAHVNRMRFGTQAHLELGNIELSPFFYLNTTSSTTPQYKGMLAGTEFGFNLTDNIRVEGIASYSDNDTIYNGIRGEQNGFNVHLFLGYTPKRKEE